eukprot:scaffold137_cov398-Prasinococcus_capsulatus_cf.AAC.16
MASPRTRRLPVSAGVRARGPPPARGLGPWAVGGAPTPGQARRGTPSLLVTRAGWRREGATASGGSGRGAARIADGTLQPLLLLALSAVHHSLERHARVSGRPGGG